MLHRDNVVGFDPQAGVIADLGVHTLESVEAAIELAKGAAQSDQARLARRVLEDAAKVESEALARVERDVERDEPNGGRLIVGQRVRLAQGGTGTIREVRTDGKLVVTLGAVKVVVEPTAATAVAGGPILERPRPSGDLIETVGASEIDLRGMRADEAAQVTLAALDAAILAEHPWLRIIHGMGTGAVRDRVRQVLRTDKRVAKYDFAPRNQGGSGVTVVEFKDAS